MCRHYNVHLTNAMASQITNKPNCTWRHFRLWGRHTMAPVSIYSWEGSRDKLGVIWDEWRHIETVERHLRWVKVDLRHIEVVERHSLFAWAGVNSGPNQLDVLNWDVLWHLDYTGIKFKTSGLTWRRITLNSDQFERSWDEWLTLARSKESDISKM